MSEEQVKQSQLPAVVDHGTFDLHEVEDEAQILSEIQGRSAQKLMYSFPSSEGKVVEGLSYSGIRWAAREYSRKGEVIRIVGKPEVMKDPTSDDHIVIAVQAQRFSVDPETGREIALDNCYGIKRFPLKMELRSGAKVPDKFFMEKCLNMAQRNAVRALLPVDFVIEILKRIKSGKTDEAPRKTPEKPQKPAGPLKNDEAQSAVGAAPPQDEPAPPARGRDMQIGPRIHVNLKKLVRTDDVCRKVLADLTGKGKTSELDPKILEGFNADVVKCFPGGPHELKQNPEGKWVMMERGSVRFVWPKGAATVPGSPAAEEKEMF